MYLPDNISSVDYDAFAFCDNLEKVTIPAGYPAHEAAFEDRPNVKIEQRGG